MFLYEEFDNLRKYRAIQPLPPCIRDSLNPRMPLRPYQVAAFENFVTYFQRPGGPKRPCQVLFHMATGSGKTLIMAGLIAYLYQQGYRNFLFFVNLTTIVQQTRDIFLNPGSAKYLFAPEILVDGHRVQIREVSNFQSSDPEAVNILFTTTQSLHTDLWMVRENGLSLEDFAQTPVVLLSDEAHHLNASTKRMDRAEAASYHSWEETVRRIFLTREDNVLLEFTATCDLANPQILEAYRDKILFNYPLQNFRADRYSKEIITLRADLSPMDRALQALMLSQYRLKVFQANRLPVKPVVLFKSAKIQESAAFQAAFAERLRTLTGGELERISTLIQNPAMRRAYAWFARRGISFDALAQELREDFSPEHCISANDDAAAERKQLLLNSLEAPENPYRAVFEVKKLDEGWDVLNLFDIVRLYETRQSGGRRISASTSSEAQLIVRGPRYCPLQTAPDQPRYQRKFDRDLDSELRICEELYYHCQNDSRYIAELHSALREIGIDPDRTAPCSLRLKESFRNSRFYREGLVFANSRVPLDPGPDADGLPAALRERSFPVTLATGASGEDLVMDSTPLSEEAADLRTYETTFRQLADLNYAIVYKALIRWPAFQFDALKRRFPGLSSTRMFLTDPRYLGAVRLVIRSRYDMPPAQVLRSAAEQVLGTLAGALASVQEQWTGSREFRPRRMAEVFQDKTVNVTDPQAGGAGISQNDHTVPAAWRLDLSRELWYAYEDNFGTSEEKALVAAIHAHIRELQAAYDAVYLVRNERQLSLYAFADGARFEPDFLLFLLKRQDGGWVQTQVFLEPKGTHLLQEDAWKEQFLLQLETQAVPVKVFAGDPSCRILGTHFFNLERRETEFAADLRCLIDGPPCEA